MEPTWSRLGLVVRVRVKVVAGMRIRVRARVSTRARGGVGIRMRVWLVLELYSTNKVSLVEGSNPVFFLGLLEV